jgi:ABC-2 type transport system permease protein
MRLWVIFVKTWRELWRDRWVLCLTLVFAPCFVAIYWLWTQGGSTAYTVLVNNQDRGAQLANGENLLAGEEAFQAIAAVRYPDGKPLLRAVRAADRAAVEKKLRDRAAAAFVIIPADFSQSIAALRAGDRSAATQVIFGGDLTNPYYTLGVTLMIGAIDAYVQQTSGQQPVIRYIEEPLGASGVRTEFEIYVPGIFIFAVIMLIFQAAMTIAREIEAGTLKRLQITRMTSFDLLGGITAALVTVGVISVVLTFLTAQALGFRSLGPLWLAILVGAVTSLAIIGMGMVVACFSRTVSQAFVIANFPLALLMFFTGAIFPAPKITVFVIGERAFGLWDLLPPTHAVAALNKVLTFGAGLPEVAFELTALLVLSVAYFAAGVWLFGRTQLR